MTETLNYDSQCRKGEAIIVKWINNDFNLHKFLTSGFTTLESPSFRIKGSPFETRFRLIPGGKQNDVLCFFIMNSIDSYYIESEITIDKEIWKTNEKLHCYLYESMSSINRLVFKNKNYFPEKCKLIIKLSLRKCIFRRFSSKYFSATTELSINTESRISSPRNQRELEERVVNDESTQNGDSSRNDLLTICRFSYSYDRNSLEIDFEAPGADSLYLSYEIQVFDNKNNNLIASKKDRNLLLNSVNWLNEMLLPSYVTEEIGNRPSDFFDAFMVYSMYSIHIAKNENVRNCEYGSNFNQFRKRRSNLKADLKNFCYNNARINDLCIKCEGTTFQVHRYILAARSPVFKAMLENDMLERRTGLIETVELNSEQLRLLLNFIYYSEIHVVTENENAVTLYAAADKYEIPSLFSVCRRDLKKNISLENLHELLLLSILHRDLKLKKFVTSFLRTWDNPKPEVISRLDMMFDRPLTEEDVRFLQDMKSFLLNDV